MRQIEVSNILLKPRDLGIWRTDICGIVVAGIKAADGPAQVGKPIWLMKKVFGTRTIGAILTKLEAIV